MEEFNRRRLAVTRLVLEGHTIKVVGRAYNVTPARISQIFYRTMRDAVKYSGDDRAILCKFMKEYREQQVMWNEILDKLASGYYR